MAESEVQEFPGYVQKSSHKPRLLLIFVILLVLTIIVLIGLYLLGAKTKKLTTFISSVPHLSPTLQPTSMPSATVSATVTTAATPSGKLTITPTLSTTSRSALSLAVLNGSGVPGAAEKVSEKLTGLGYNVTTTGNADTFTYQGITIKVKKTASSYLPLLKKDLASESASISAGIDNAISVDAEVIVGK